MLMSSSLAAWLCGDGSDGMPSNKVVGQYLCYCDSNMLKSVNKYLCEHNYYQFDIPITKCEETLILCAMDNHQNNYNSVMFCEGWACNRKRSYVNCECWRDEYEDFDKVMSNVINYLQRSGSWCKNCLFRTWVLHTDERKYRLKYVRQISKDEKINHRIENYSVHIWKLDNAYLIHDTTEFI